MSKLVKLEVNDAVVWVEADEKVYAGDGPLKTSKKPAEGIIVGFNEFSESMKTLCNAIIQTFNDITEDNKKPKKIITEFGLKISGEGNVYVVKTAAEASLVITAEWEL